MKRQIYVRAGILLLFVLATGCTFANLARDTSSTGRAFEVSGVPYVELNSMAGDLRVNTGEAGYVYVTAELVGSSTTAEDARRTRETLVLNFSQEGDVIRITGDRDVVPGVKGDAWINYVITVPIGTRLDARMDYRSSTSSYGWASNALFNTLLFIAGAVVAIALSSVPLGMKLRRARSEIQKLTFELEAARAEAHMKEREREWTRQTKGR